MIRILMPLLLMLAAFSLQPDPADAQASVRRLHTGVTLITESKAPKAGQALTIGIRMETEKGWHVYWENPGDAGMPATAKWTLPEGVSAGSFRFPVPETFLVSGLMNHVLGPRSLLLADLAIEDHVTGPLPLVVQLEWLVCDDRLCVPESATLRLDLATGDGAADPNHMKEFAAARAALPRQLASPATYRVADARIRLSVPFANPETVTDAHFFSLGSRDFAYASPQLVSKSTSALIIEADMAGTEVPEQLTGVLRVEQGRDILGLQLHAQAGDVAPGIPLSTARAGMGVAFLPALSFAILGGLLLNLMPCVFPILSLKAMSLARSGASATAARTEGLAYSAGVVLIVSALGLVAILLAAAGGGAGWAFQLQDPRVILLLLLLTFAIGLNFAGLYEVGGRAMQAGSQLASQPGAKGAFFTGVLAAFVATPCTGPFMAGALGAALILPPLAGLAIFTGLGIGLALPFLLIGFLPPLRALLPRPGGWMITFRHILAIPMLLTTLGLAWVLGRQSGVNGLMLGLLAAFAMALGLWWLGLRQIRGAGGKLPLLLALLAFGLSPAAFSYLPEQLADAKADAPASLQAGPWSRQKLADARAQGQPVFLYFTADWCLTCKVNERGALASAAVADHFRQQGIRVMVGDWTRPDPEISAFLLEKQRAGIPYYLFLDRKGRETELPQLLTIGMLTALESRGSD